MFCQNEEGTLEEKWRHFYVPERPGLCGGMDTEEKAENLLWLLQQPPVQHGTALNVPSPRSVKE